MAARLISVVLFAASAVIVFWYALVHTVHQGTLSIPDLHGRGVTTAEKLVHDLGITLVVEEEGVFSADYAPGKIATQNPHPGFHVKAGSSISVRVSLGGERTVTPEVRSLSLQAALRALEQEGLLPTSHAEVRGQTNGDSVLATDPPQGESVPPEAEVRLLVNSAPQRQLWVMPSLLSFRVETVSRFCRRHHLRLGQTHEVDYPGLPSGVVLRQYPAAGSPLSRSDIITVWISK
ncbi:MAG: PASTA domain-containing protein [bacterium]|nr:PASTA domain-containing protein [bacterium]